MRAYDSRSTNGVLVGEQSRTTTLPVPESAVAVALNTTVTGTAGTGYIAVTPPGVGVPTTSTVNWFTSPTTGANGGFIPVGGTAARAFVGGFNSTHYLYDVAGYFR